MREIYQRLGLTSTLEKEKEKFFNRIHTTFYQMYYNIGSPLRENISYEMSFDLGERHYEYSDFLFNYDRGRKRSKQFEEILLVCELFLKVLLKLSKKSYIFFYERLEDAFENSVIDLGYSLVDGKIINQGDEELDKRLLIEPLQWLKKYPNAREFFEGALTEYLHKDFPDTITKSYSAIDSLAKTILGSEKRLDAQIPELLQALELPQEWKAILNNYCKYAHEFSSRHGKGEGKKAKQKYIKVNEKDVEAYLYFTGLMIKLVVRSVKL